MSVSRKKPFSSLPLLDIRDSINIGQVGWWLANEGAGNRLANIANPNRFTGTLQAGATWSNHQTGRTVAFDGGANAYVDLGTASLIPSTTTPLTLSWIENPGTSPPAFAGLACFKAADAAQRWLLFREDSDVSYRYLSFGLGSAATARKFSTAPTMASGVGVAKHFLLLIPDGMAGTTTTAAGPSLYVDGVRFTTIAGSAISAQAANLNYLGWDGADAKWKGNLDNFRLWTRALSGAELNQLIADPSAGTARARTYFLPAPAAQPLHRMFLAL